MSRTPNCQIPSANFREANEPEDAKKQGYWNEHLASDFHLQPFKMSNLRKKEGAAGCTPSSVWLEIQELQGREPKPSRRTSSLTNSKPFTTIQKRDRTLLLRWDQV